MKSNQEQERVHTGAVGPMAPRDAMWHWFATKFATDQFVTYAFDGVPDSVTGAIATTLDRALEIPYLNVRIREDASGLRFPRWELATPVREQCILHELSTPTWTGCLHEVALLVGDQLDPRVAAWRLHVFSPVFDVPGASGPATVVTLQISHTLGDGSRASGLAGALLGRDEIPGPIAVRATGSSMRGLTATLRARRELARDIESGKVPAEKGLVAALSVNDPPFGTPILRTVVRKKAQLPGPTPTIGVLVAISEALSGYLRARGEDDSQLTAAVPVAKPGVPQSYNHLDVARIGLHPDAPGAAEKIARISADFAAWRQRSNHPSAVVEAAVWSTIPAPVRRLAIRLMKTDIRPQLVPAHTTLSSVNRGAADVSFGGCRVLFSAGFPALLPISSLTHGAYEIGDTVTVTVHASAPQVDVDDYVARLEAAIPH